MKPKDIIFSTLRELAHGLRARSVSSELIVRAYLDRIEAINPILNAVVSVAPESAIEQAKAADADFDRGAPVGPLHGLPFSVKDVYPIVESAELIDAPEIAGLLELPRDREATIVTRLRQAGAIPIAVTRATWWSSREDHYGAAHNPYNLLCETGGSSGGEAALIAAGGSPFGIGSDSGGSLRIPAHYCGIATLRPSNGRVPRGIDAAGTNDPRTVAGPLARSVLDLAMVMPILCGVDTEDPTTLPIPWRDDQGVGVSGLRVGVFTNNGLVTPSSETCETVMRAAAVLVTAGAIVDEIKHPHLDEAWEITLDYWRYCGAVGELQHYFEFLDRWDRYRIALSKLMMSYDALLCPTEGYSAGPIETMGTGTCCTYTAPFSLVGLPCAVVRAGSSSEGMPIGVQVVGAPWRDDLALAIALCIERGAGGWSPPAEAGRLA